jgi:hypothetical protein
MKFWKPLTDAKFTGRPPQLTTGDMREMAEAQWLPGHKIEDVLRGFLEFLKQTGQKEAPSGFRELIAQGSENVLL